MKYKIDVPGLKAALRTAGALMLAMWLGSREADEKAKAAER